MCFISVTNLKEIHLGEGCFFLAQSYCFESVLRKMWRKLGNFQKHISRKLLIWFSSNLVCKIVYMKGITYLNLIEIGPVVIEIWGVENGSLAVLVNIIPVSRYAKYPNSFIQVVT